DFGVKFSEDGALIASFVHAPKPASDNAALQFARDVFDDPAAYHITVRATFSFRSARSWSRRNRWSGSCQRRPKCDRSCAVRLPWSQRQRLALSSRQSRAVVRELQEFSERREGTWRITRLTNDRPLQAKRLPPPFARPIRPTH